LSRRALSIVQKINISVLQMTAGRLPFRKNGPLRF
jgi:hypothetical protein